MGAVEATAFLNHLAMERRVAASTQNQALCALVFLYGRVVGLETTRTPMAGTSHPGDGSVPRLNGETRNAEPQRRGAAER
jgi:hypothetical protein